MVYLDWNKIMAITPETFTEDDKEELANSVIWYSPASELEKGQLTALIKVMQEIIKHKIDQVESLMSALDELAAKQGEEVARGRQDLLDELDELREQLEYQRRLERDNILPDDQLRGELVRLEMQNEELVQELHERDKDLTTEKLEVERLIGEITRLEKEKLLAVRELATLQDETNERIGRSVSDSPDGGTEKVEELIDVIRQKNKHIMHLLDDIEAVEHDNQELKVKAANMRDQMNGNHEELRELKERMAAMQVLLDDEQKKVLELSGQNMALTSQIEESSSKAAKHDKDLDEFAATLNLRVDEWRRLLDLKDIEIQAVTDELNKFLSSNTHWNEALYDAEAPARLFKQEQEIIKLKTELTKALHDNNRKDEIIEEFKLNIAKLENTSDWHLKIQTMEDEISELKEQLHCAEEEATSKAKEITKLVVQLRCYERDEFGLSDAVDQVKKLEKILSGREVKIEETISVCNQLEIDKGVLEDENILLREKFGLSPKHFVDTSSVQRNSKVDAETVNDLKMKLEKAHETIVELKLKNRSLNTQLLSCLERVKNVPETEEPENETTFENKQCNDVELLKRNYSLAVEENDALRKGMHEILEGVQSQTVGELEITSLERLLEALDARHVSGWYHPAMRLQAQVSAMKGECRELRSQIRTLREEKMMLADELETARRVSHVIEEKLVAVEINTPEKGTTPENSSAFNSEEQFKIGKRCRELEEAISQQSLAFDKVKAEWNKERRGLIKEKDTLAIQIANINGRNIKIAELNVVGLKQANELLSLREIALEEEIKVLQDNFISEQEKLLDRLHDTKNDNSELLNCVHDLQSSISRLVPLENVIELEKQLSTLRLQYNMVVSSQMLKEPVEINELGDSCSNWEDVEKRELLNELRAVKEKLCEREVLLSTLSEKEVSPDSFNHQLSILASKLSASEVRETSERQKNIRLGHTIETLKAQIERNNNEKSELNDQVKFRTELSEKLQEALDEAERIMSQDAFGEPAKSTNDLENSVAKLTIEKRNLVELLEISRNQYRSLKLWQARDRLEKNSYSEYLSLLLSSPGEKLSTLRLNQDLISMGKKNLELEAKNYELTSHNASLTAENLAKDVKVNDAANELKSFKAQNLSKTKCLFIYFKKLHSACSDALMFPTLSKAQKLINDLKEQNVKISEELRIIDGKKQDLAIREQEFLVQLEALNDLKAAFQSDSKNLVNWHNKSTELRLRETRHKKRNEFLLEEVSRMENQVKNMSEEILHIEEKAVEREREWAEQQKEWIEYQLHLFGLTAKLPETSGRGHINSQEEVKNLNLRIDELEQINAKLLLRIKENEASYKQQLSEQLFNAKTLELEEASELKKCDSLGIEKSALQITVDSLQSMVKQKEDTVSRYQDLLKKTREDHANTVRRLQRELKNVHNALALQSKAYSRLKHGTYQPRTVDIEKYINKVQELEEEVSELKTTVSRLNCDLNSSQKDCIRWKEVAEEKMTLAEEVRDRMEMELERCREEIQSQEMEIHNLRDMAHDDYSHKLLDTIQDLQKKITDLRNQTVPPRSSRKNKSEDSADDNLEGENNLRRQLKSSQDECIRLREQLKYFRELKRRPTSAKLSKNEENLVGKIHKLEEMLQLSKQHEQELEEQELKKIKSVEEVTRWDERKRYQKNVERLGNKLKQKEVEAAVALNKLETMRGLMAKLEREKIALDVQLRNLSESARNNTKMERLLEEKATLTVQVATLEEEILALQRHEGGKAAAMLHTKLAAQERKIVALELAEQSPVELAAELDRLRLSSSALERKNLQLESENLNLKLNLEKLRIENQQLNGTCKRLEDEKRTRVQAMAGPLSRTQTRMAYDNQREVNQLKIEHKTGRERLLTVEKRNAELEEEIQRLLNQLGLWEEKDIADSLTRTKQQQMVSDLHQQLISVKGQLAHKVHLLDRVKILLSKAAAKEKALNEKVSALQTIVEQSG